MYVLHVGKLDYFSILEYMTLEQVCYDKSIYITMKTKLKIYGDKEDI